MAIDYLGLWALVIVNTLGLLLVVRQLATLPQYSRSGGLRERKGPALGTALDDWSLASLGGGIRHASELPASYTLLFVASTCEPCHKLIAELKRERRPAGPLYLIANGDAQAVAAEASSDDAKLYDELLLTGSGDLYQRLDVPGTPYAVAVSERKIARAGIAASAADLVRIAGAPAIFVAAPSP